MGVKLKIAYKGPKIVFGGRWCCHIYVYLLQFQEFLEIVWPTWRKLSESELGMLAILAPSM